jgi:hypothetical protein
LSPEVVGILDPKITIPAEEAPQLWHIHQIVADQSLGAFCVARVIKRVLGESSRIRIVILGTTKALAEPFRKVIAQWLTD